jgi:arylsulfatase A-like enzyme
MAYAAMISRMDASVGQLVARLDDPNGDGDKSDSVLDNTLILFTSDNGPTPEDDSPIEFFDASGKYRGGKRDLYEGGIHVPALAYWKGTIAPGSTSDYRTDLADFLPTACELAGVEPPADIDGVSILPTLTGQGEQRERKYLVFEHHERSGPVDPDPRAARWAVIRQDGKKLIRYEDGTSDLFDVAADPSESQSLDANNAQNAKLKSELEVAAAEEAVDQVKPAPRKARARARRSAENRGRRSGR